MRNMIHRPPTSDKLFVIHFDNDKGEPDCTLMTARDLDHAMYIFEANVGLPIVRIDMVVYETEEDCREQER